MRTYASYVKKPQSKPIPQAKSPVKTQLTAPLPPTIHAKSNEEGLAEWKAQQEKWARLGTPWMDKVPNLNGELVQPWLQRKLTLGQPGDKYEQEADRTASQVVQHINSSTFTHPTQGKPVQRGHESEKLGALIQRRQAMASRGVSPDLESAINSKRGSGQPLEEGLQRSMGQAMGADFSGVRVHTDSQSDQLNQSIQARAFTTGQDVFFQKGAYQPKSQVGQELIAHELTHVIQQNSTVQRHPSITSSGKEIVQRALERKDAIKLVKKYQYQLGKTKVGKTKVGKTTEKSDIEQVKDKAYKSAVQKFKNLNKESKESNVKDPITLEQFKNMLKAAPPRKGKMTSVSEKIEKAWVGTLTELKTSSLQPGDVAIRKDLEDSTIPVIGQTFLKGGMGSKRSGHAALYIGNGNFAEATGGEKVQRVGLTDISKHAKKDNGGYYDTVFVIYRPNDKKQAKAAVGIARWITLAELGYSNVHCAVPGTRRSKYGTRAKEYGKKLKAKQKIALNQGELMDALNAKDYEWMCRNIQAFQECGIKGIQREDISNLATNEGVSLSKESKNSDAAKVTKLTLKRVKKTLLEDIRREVRATVGVEEMMCSEFVTTCFQSVGEDTLIKQEGIATSPLALENYLIGNPDKFTVQGAYTVAGAKVKKDITSPE